MYPKRPSGYAGGLREAVPKPVPLWVSGGMIVMDETTCMVDMARFFMNFTQEESCGKCVHCRIGTKRMLEILDRIVEGKGREGDIELLEELGQGSLTVLSADWAKAPQILLYLPLLNFAKNITPIFMRKMSCPINVSHLTFTIDEDKCTGCGACAKKMSGGRHPW